MRIHGNHSNICFLLQASLLRTMTNRGDLVNNMETVALTYGE